MQNKIQRNMFNIKGKVIALSPIRTGVSKTGSPWQSQDVVVEYDSGTYTNKASFVLFNKTIDVRVNDEVEIDFNVNAREWQGKWYNTLNATDIRVVIVQQATSFIPTTSAQQSQQTQQQTQQQSNPQYSASPDLPF